MRGSRLLSCLALVAVAACGGSDDESTSSDETTTTSSSTTTAPAPGAVNIGDTSLGSVLVDPNGMTLYLFTKDSSGKSACDGGCATTWPPLTVTGAPTAGDGVDATKLATIARPDGAMQVTFAGHPLYTYSKDTTSGDVTGHGVGGVWFAVLPDGSAAPPSAASPGTSAPAPAPGAPATTASTARAGSPTTKPAAPATTAAPSAGTTSGTVGATAAITIQNFTFSPPVLNVAVGTTVTATNKDSAPHTWTADNGTWDSGDLRQNASFSYRFTAAGAFPYHCTIHPSMKGTVNVS